MTLHHSGYLLGIYSPNLLLSEIYVCHTGPATLSLLMVSRYQSLSPVLTITKHSIHNTTVIITTATSLIKTQQIFMSTILSVLLSEVLYYSRFRTFQNKPFSLGKAWSKHKTFNFCLNLKLNLPQSIQTISELCIPVNTKYTTYLKKIKTLNPTIWNIHRNVTLSPQRYTSESRSSW